MQIIQAMWRGVSQRQLHSKTLLNELLQKRAAVLLQRWWRMRNGLHRRLRMLERVSRMCLKIESRYV